MQYQWLLKPAKELVQTTTAQGPPHFVEGIYKKGFRAFYLCFHQLRYFTPTLIYILLLSFFFFSFGSVGAWCQLKLVKKENVSFSKYNIIVLKAVFPQYLVNSGLFCNKYSSQNSFPFLQVCLDLFDQFYSHMYSYLCIKLWFPSPFFFFF